MHLVIKKEVAQRIGYDHFIPFDVSRESWQTWREEQVIDLAKLSANEIDSLEEMLGRFKKVRGAGVLLNDIATWKRTIREGAAQMKARTVRQFETLLRRFMLDVPGKRLYKRHDDGMMLCYYVNRVEYHPPINDSRSPSPAYVTMGLIHEEVGGAKQSNIEFYDDDCRNVPVAVALAEKWFTAETPALRKAYLEDKELFVQISNSIGKQYWASGIGFQDQRDSWRSSTVRLDRYGESSRAVVDVFFEEGKAPRDIRPNINIYFWPNVAKQQSYDPLKDEDNSELDDDTTLERPEIEIPIHPWIIIFDLQKHVRLRVHVRQLEEYIYDERLSDKLVLPENQKQLVELLIETKGGLFQDIVRGKGGGAVVLLGGEPGTGKTLTAEVYAESEKRALYSIQCSQLGLTPEKLEEHLMLAFERARRWNAVMLLDEADVYIHERGNSLQQNAIVGVFLRVLEYQNSVLFLATNRPEDVDDAIASRCIARINYGPPEPKNAIRIWQILAQLGGIALEDDVIEEVVRRNPGMTGRDIKNILKLGRLMVPPEDGLTVEEIEYVQQFKPTGKLAIE